MDSLLKVFSVAIGGAFGASARYLVSVSPLAGWFGKFPFPTFLINVVGSFLIGFLMIIFTDKFPVNDNLRLAITVGFLGAFTTFSTFEMEIYGLIESKLFLSALVYLSASVFLGFAAVLSGVWLAKKF